MNSKRIYKLNKQRMVTMTTAVASLVLLAGCTMGLEQKAENAVNRAAEAVEGSVSRAADHISDEIRERSVSRQLAEVKQVTGDAAEFYLNNAVGTVKVTPAQGSEMVVKTTIWSPEKTLHKDIQLKVLDQAEVSVIVEGDQAKVVTHAKDHPELNLWDWAEQEYGYSEFSLDYEIQLPASLEQFEITNNVGELTLSGLSGEYRIISDVGSVVLDNAHIKGSSSVQAGTGSLQLGISQMETGSKLGARTEVGSIKAALHESLACNLEIDSNLGSISGAPEGTSERNGGGPLLSLSSSVGSIDVE